eukprot:c7943_g1_i1.p1 GENE.c7943_g1_i1~~c7943_g1_i1.p1  ORF type:complete len:195 (+),score=28.30 c7943_g1_i1:44-628(+)
MKLVALSTILLVLSPCCAQISSPLRLLMAQPPPPTPPLTSTAGATLTPQMFPPPQSTLQASNPPMDYVPQNDLAVHTFLFLLDLLMNYPSRPWTLNLGGQHSLVLPAELGCPGIPFVKEGARVAIAKSTLPDDLAVAVVNMFAQRSDGNGDSLKSSLATAIRKFGVDVFWLLGPMLFRQIVRLDPFSRTLFYPR